MLKKCRQPELFRRKRASRYKKTDYGNYIFSPKEWVICLGQGIGEICILGYFFYHSWKMTVLISPLLIILIRQKKQELCEKRKQELTTQFKEMMNAIGNSLQVGYSLENAFLEAYIDMNYYYTKEGVIVKELYHIQVGIKNGMQVEELLQDLGERSGVEDIFDFANVLAIAKKSGGNMIGIIKSGISVIEEKIDTRQEIQILISSKKFEAKIMSVIPFFIIGYIGMASKGYFDTLYQSAGGKIFMSICLVVYIVALGLSKKITEIDF